MVDLGRHLPLTWNFSINTFAHSSAGTFFSSGWQTYLWHLGIVHRDLSCSWYYQQMFSPIHQLTLPLVGRQMYGP